MRVPNALSSAFDASFEELISRFATEQGLLPSADDIRSTRFLSRSVIPHVQKLSQLFNRIEKEEEPEGEDEAPTRKPRKSQKISRAQAAQGLEPYWKESSNPANLRLAYFLYFMPSNLFRMASVWSELSRLGFRWPERLTTLRGIELGAGPASGACGIAAGEKFAPTGLPQDGNWALIEQDRAMLELGSDWAKTYFAAQGFGNWDTRTFQRRLDFKGDLLPRNAPRFNLWLMSFFLNESDESPELLARKLMETWDKHLEEEGVAILVEPALKAQSRKLLELRKAILAEIEKKKTGGLKLLLPCLGHQACGALAGESDWCHEEVSWWRPPYFRKIDQMAGLDRKTLPFSYLVFSRSQRTLDEVLPKIATRNPEKRVRLVSPAHSEGKDLEFFFCSQEGKRRARFRPDSEEMKVGRGDILMDTEVRGDVHASRIESAKKPRE